MNDPEHDLQSEDGADINWFAGQTLKWALLIFAAICGILGMRHRKRR